MSDWQERITHETAPAIRAEHELRYRTVAPLVAKSGVWVDLGCGTGLAAQAALTHGRPQHAVLVDADRDAMTTASHELGLSDTRQIAGDLTDSAALAQVAEAMLEVAGDRLVSCFEVVEHLDTFLPLLEWSGPLAREGAATFVMSVPNDAFWSIDNPYHATSWSEGAFEEFARLLPAERTLIRQVALTGSGLIDWDATPWRADLQVEVGGESAVATHFIAAFGPRHQQLQLSALTVQTDQLAQRRWERQRESNLALAEATLATQREELRMFTSQFDDWRAYIHELERELGRPLSGVDADGEATEASSSVEN